MSAFRMLLVPAALLCAATFSPFVAAQTGGVINFEGAIVEPPCDVRANASDVTLSCERQGQVKTQQFSLHNLTQERTSNGNLVTMKINYLNPAHTLAVMDITYN